MADMVRFGRGIRALRRKRRCRQTNLAIVAGVSATTVSRIERGRGDQMPVRLLERVAHALGSRVQVRLDWNGEALDRLLDADHARLVESVVRQLRSWGWDVATEVTFAIGGERGSVDILARHVPTAMLLVVEVKTVVPDVQGMLAAFDRKVRLAFVIARQRGWDGGGVGRVLVITDGRTTRRRLAAHTGTFDAVVPDRTAAARCWLAKPDPDRPVRGLWLLSDPGSVSRHRIRAPR